MGGGGGQEEYIRQVLEAYRKTPGTMGTVRRPDRVLAAQLYQRGISVSVTENAFVLAVTRRLMRPAEAPPLGTIRSLAYFLPVIEEVLELRVPVPGAVCFLNEPPPAVNRVVKPSAFMRFGMMLMTPPMAFVP
jgi:hypothetical protein